MNKQSHAILHSYLKEIGISVNKSKLKQLLYSHPEHNSLYAMVDVLEELHIEHAALRTDMDGLQANGFPVIVHTTEHGGTFMIIENIAGDSVSYYKAGEGQGREPLEGFQKKWSGAALYAVADEQSSTPEKNRTKSECLQNMRLPLLVMSGMVCIVAWNAAVAWSVELICLLCLSVAGLVISILLTMHESGESNRLLHKVCHLNRRTNCNEVLGSPASKLFGWLSMADIGLCYFSGSVVSLLLAGCAQQLISALSWLSILALCTLPYTIFSLCYQAFRIKKWCPLCLGVIAVLWAECTLAFAHWQQISLFPVSSLAVFSLLAGFLLPLCIWMYVKPLWLDYKRIREYEYKYLRLRNNPFIIRAFLDNEPACNMDFSNHEIHLGSVSAPVHITVVASLRCRPCATEWQTLSGWLAVYPGSFWLTVRFVGHGSHDSESINVIEILTELYTTQGEEMFCKAVTDWFDSKDYPTWKAKYEIPVSPAVKTLSQHYDQWTNDLPITYTPTIFVDNHILPSTYRLADLLYLIKNV